MWKKFNIIILPILIKYLFLFKKYLINILAMGNQTSSIVQKINFEDLQYAIKRKDIIINTLPHDEQSLLIVGTVNIQNESEMFNTFIKKSEYDRQIIIYGKNSNDVTIFKRYEQDSRKIQLIFR